MCEEVLRHKLRKGWRIFGRNVLTNAEKKAEKLQGGYVGKSAEDKCRGKG